ncbi:helix-turn-helix domain-containing protein [Brevundimonas sp. GCM10030266]|uniref:helix-turn-helix domain-containing protein n=1 Tax=Brevundimonas sp. GCM10030266 TaxID=3273386 RepID=UPI00361246C0
MSKTYHRPKGHIATVGSSGCVIVADVSRLYGLTVRGLREDTRRPNVVRARQHAMSALRDAGYSVEAIGLFFGRDHSTVSHADVTHLRRAAPSLAVAA